MNRISQLFRQPNVLKHRLTSLVRYASDIASKEEIDTLLKRDKVVVFMKGVPEAPQCGFSNAVVQILRMHGVQYESHNVLEDQRLRQGVKDYANWPTIPQIYLSGQFLGGCDIMLQMHQNGELIEELEKVGIKSLLLEKDGGDGGGQDKS